MDEQDLVVATLPNGDRLTFPKGTSDDVVDAAVKRHIATAPPIKDGVTANRDFEQTFPAHAQTPDVMPGSPRDRLEKFSESTFGSWSPQVNRLARVVALNNPATAGIAAMLEGGAQAGGMFGGAAGGIAGTAAGGPTGGYAGAVTGASLGGGTYGAADRWFRGQPTTAGDVAWDAGSQGAMEAVAPAIGASLTHAARPIYRMALNPGRKLVQAFGDVAEEGLTMPNQMAPRGGRIGRVGRAIADAIAPKRGVPVSASGEALAERGTTAARQHAMGLVDQVDEADPRLVTSHEVLGRDTQVDEAFKEARRQHRAGEVVPVDAMQQRLEQVRANFGDRPYVTEHGTPKMTTGKGLRYRDVQPLKEDTQAVAAKAFEETSSTSKPVRARTAEDDLKEAIARAMQDTMEERATAQGVDLGAANAVTKRRLGLTLAQRQAQERHLAGGRSSVLPSAVGATAGALTGIASGHGPMLGAGAGASAVALAQLLRSPAVSSRVALGMDRTGRAIGGQRLSNAVRALAMALAGNEEP